MVIEVGRLWRCLDLLEVTSMSSVLLSRTIGLVVRMSILDTKG